jgi:Protein of unknown function DUF262
MSNPEEDYDDIESLALAEDENEEKTPLRFWEQKQRELVQSVVDYNLGTLADLIESKTIDLSPRYQRRFRWDPRRQSKLVESLLMNVPIPPIFLNEDEYGHYSVIDGKQRLTAIFEFLRGRLRLEGLEIFSDINGQTVDELSTDLQQVLRIRPTLRAIIILRQSDEDVKFEVFKRLNTGGVTLNAQEIRNSTNPGPLNDLVLDLSESKDFHRLLRIKNPQRSKTYQEMRDCELVLRFLTFRDTWHSFQRGMKRAMDHFMASNQRPDLNVLAEFRQDFTGTLAAVEAAFGEYAFRRWVPQNLHWRRQILASLFDAEMFACRGLDPATLKLRQDEIIQGLQQLFDDDEFRRAIDSATNTPGYVKTRVEMVRNLLVRTTEE